MRAWLAAAGGDPEAMRKVRVATRRLREVLRISGTVAARRRADALVESLRAIRRALGAVRDDAVVLERVAAYRDRDDTGPAVREIDALVAGRERRALKVLARTLSPGSAQRVGASIDLVVRTVQRGRSQAPYAKALWSALLSRSAEARRAADAAGPVYEPEQLHNLRLAIKKLRYAVELAVQALFVPRTLSARLRRHQKRLGLWHDYVAVVDFMRVEEARRGPESPESWAMLLDVVDREARVLFGQIRRGHRSLDRCLGDVRAAVAGALVGGRRQLARAGLHDVVRRRGARS